MDDRAFQMLAEIKETMGGLSADVRTLTAAQRDTAKNVKEVSDSQIKMELTVDGLVNKADTYFGDNGGGIIGKLRKTVGQHEEFISKNRGTIESNSISEKAKEMLKSKLLWVWTIGSGVLFACIKAGAENLMQHFNWIR